VKRTGDLEALLAEARDPETAARIIAQLHGRVNELQRVSDELRIELTMLQRAGRSVGGVVGAERLQTDLRDLRAHARRAGLDFDTLALVAGDGTGMLVPMPAPIDQALQLEAAAGESLRDLRPLHVVPSTRLGTMLIIDSSFRLHFLNGLGLPVSDEWRWAQAQRSGQIMLARGERIEAMCAVDEYAPPKYVLVVARSGWCRALPWRMVENLAAGGATFGAGASGDAPAWIGPCHDGDVVLLTRLGRCVRFPLGALAATGEVGARLDEDDDVVGAVVIPAERGGGHAVHFIGADGAHFAVSADGLDAHKRAGGRTHPLMRNWTAATCATATRRDAYALIGMNGEVQVVGLRALPVAEKPHEARALNVLGQRLLSAVVIPHPLTPLPSARGGGMTGSIPLP